MTLPRRAGLLFTLLALVLGPAAGAQSAAPYKIGVTFPLTGPLAASGLQYLPAIEVAVAQVNRRGGVNGRREKAGGQRDAVS